MPRLALNRKDLEPRIDRHAHPYIDALSSREAVPTSLENASRPPGRVRPFYYGLIVTAGMGKVLIPVQLFARIA